MDVLFETQQGLKAVEIKLGSTFASDWPNAANKWRSFAGNNTLRPKIIYGGHDSHERESCRLVSWKELGKETVL